ncbi:MAG: hypothetical protein BWY85_02180 [Firmicutes bacterium ADurb.Bin506]|nr:MAG: hypothetical protein BWY85_02180 [Firmicutes bacterium ADurb.Bin506]
MHFAEDEGVRLDGADVLAERPPELRIHLVGDVETPTIDVEGAGPVFGHAEQIVSHLRIVGAKLRHCPHVDRERLIVRPRLYPNWEALYVEPVYIG